ncbi:MAG: ribonuclease P protein component [Candidatus Paceibacterota bacterium]
MIPQNRRIGKRLIEQVIKDGKSLYSPYLTLKILPTEGPSLWGFVVSKKVSKKAVERNFIKRRARYIVRKNINKLADGYLYVMIFKPEARHLTFNELEQEVVKLLPINK